MNKRIFWTNKRKGFTCISAGIIAVSVTFIPDFYFGDVSGLFKLTPNPGGRGLMNEITFGLVGIAFIIGGFQWLKKGKEAENK